MIVFDRKVNHFILKCCYANYLMRFSHCCETSCFHVFWNCFEIRCCWDYYRKLMVDDEDSVEFSVSVLCLEKIICTVPFLDTQEPHSWRTLKANVCVFLYISVRKFLFQRRSKVLSDGDGKVWTIWTSRVRLSLNFS